MSGQVRGENTRTLLLKLLAEAAARSPTLVVLEDAHWQDSASWALASLVSRQIPSMLLLLATRPFTQNSPAEYNQLLRGPRTTHLRLERLAAGETAQLLAQCLGVRRRAGRGGQRWSSKWPKAIRCSSRSWPTPSATGAAAGRGRPMPLGRRLPRLEPAGFSRHLARRDRQPHRPAGNAATTGRQGGQRDRAPFPLPRTARQLPVGKRETQAQRAPGAGPAGGDRRAWKRRSPRPAISSGTSSSSRWPTSCCPSSSGSNCTTPSPNGTRSPAPTIWPSVTLSWRTTGGTAGEPAKAVEYLEKAGEQSLRSGGYSEAAGFFAEALDLDVRGPAGHQRRFGGRAGSGSLGEACLGLGRLPESRTASGSAPSPCWAAPRPATPARLTANFLRHVLRQCARRALPGFGRRGGPKGSPDDDPDLEAARAYERLAEIYYLSGEKPRLLHAMLVTLNLTERAGPSAELARAYASNAFTAGLLGLHATGPHLRAATPWRPPSWSNDPVATAWVWGAAGISALGLGEAAQAQDALQKAIDIYRPTRRLAALGRVHGHAGSGGLRGRRFPAADWNCGPSAMPPPAAAETNCNRPGA